MFLWECMFLAADGAIEFDTLANFDNALAVAFCICRVASTTACVARASDADDAITEGAALK